MRSRTPLVLMEQMIMLLVFALAAALCLQAFVKSDRISADSENRDRAALLCQNAAEAVQACQGDMAAAAAALEAPYPGGQDNTELLIYYNEDWETTGDPADYAFCLRVSRAPQRVYGMGGAEVAVSAVSPQGSGREEAIFSLDVAWQEEVLVHG